MGNRDNYFTNGLIFLVLGNLSESWIKYVNFTVGAMFIISSLGNSEKAKRDSNE
jgi:hypothetical protein